jgi:hypothetical protein
MILIDESAVESLGECRDGTVVHWCLPRSVAAPLAHHASQSI